MLLIIHQEIEMRYINFFIILVTLFTLEGCAIVDSKLSKGTALPGTETAIVELYIDKNGYPQANIDKVIVYPGQKIIFAGPDKFDILFKDQKSPIGKLEIQSSNGIVTIEIPKDIFERTQREPKAADSRNIKQLLYRYGIRVNDKVTDPEIGVNRR